MRNLEELENRWLIYKIKSILLPTVKVSAVYLVGVSLYYLYDQQNKRTPLVLPPSTHTKVLGVTMKATDFNNSSLAKKSLPKEIEKRVEKVTLVPIIPVIDMQKEEHIKVVQKKRKKHKRHKTARTHNAHLVQAKPNTYLTPKELGVRGKATSTALPLQSHKEVHKTKKMNFTSTSVNYVEKIKAKFQRSNNPRDALLLAKLYYKKSDFQSAEQWALSANKLDNNLEESWLLFAKSKAKLGKNHEALKILVSYYKKSKSTKAKALIMAIKRGQI